MKQKSENSRQCEPIKRLLESLKANKFILLESELEDYHFNQFRFKLMGDINKIPSFEPSTISYNQGFYICNCHWSRIEIIPSNEQVSKL